MITYKKASITLYSIICLFFLTCALSFAQESIPGDINGDGIVDKTDLFLISKDFGKTGPSKSDVNGDGIVDRQDLLLVRENFGKKKEQIDTESLVITPPDNSTFLAGAKIEVKVNSPTAREFQFSIGGAVKQPWSTSNTYIWQTSSSDIGAVDITCEVKDNKGQVTSRTIAYHIIDPAVEEILQKVADNYAKIQDFKADMVLSSTLDGKPFGETEYCRYYFKAPNKEKTESFTDSQRSTKTDIIIINGPIMHLIDPVKKIIQEVNLLDEAGINSAQFYQMDLYYNQTAFLKNHIVSRNKADTNFDNLIIALDAIPKTPNTLYSKLELHIDYMKGLLVKLLTYKENENKEIELIQSIEVIETQKMPNRAWFPVKMNKIPVLKSGNLIETANYSNMEINTGLTELNFNPNKQY